MLRQERVWVSQVRVSVKVEGIERVRSKTLCLTGMGGFVSVTRYCKGYLTIQLILIMQRLLYECSEYFAASVWMCRYLRNGCNRNADGT
jgi:hypothetical protein